MANKRFPGKVSQLVAVDEQIWQSFDELRLPYGSLNDLLEDYIKILLGKQPKHKGALLRLNEVVPKLLNEIS
jgi:hypothetical protein